MSGYDKYGFYRSLEPRGSFPISAWKLNNDMTLGNNELLVDVKILKIAMSSFLQLQEESKGNIGKMANKIIETVNERGKMHNCVTGTGGILYGKVVKLGKAYKNDYDVEVGDEIITLVSLRAIPLKIDRILSIDMHSAQVEVIGQAIIFEDCPIVKKPDTLPLKLCITSFEMAGDAAVTLRIVKEGDNVIVLGSASKWGLICSFSARDKIGSSGRIIGVVNTVEDKRQIEKYHIFDQVVNCDGSNTLKMIELLEPSGLFDVVINCQGISYTGTASVLLAKNKGTVYFEDSWGSDSKTIGLTAEAVGKDLTIIYHIGYVEGHVKLLISLIEKYPILRDILDAGLSEDPWNNLLKASLSLYASKSGNGHPFVFESAISKELLKNALKAAKYDCTVLINGESGVGKEVIAQIIHENSNRNSFNYVKINCAAIPEHLLEAELFGYEKGAFTGADPKGKIGLWEKANHGILFLDEISELPLRLQSKLLRAVQENEIYKIGGTAAIKTDVRIIAATNNNLLEMVKRKEFREDLYFRLNVFAIHIPPLRERKDDIVPLINMFAKEYNKKYNTHRTISEGAMKTLCSFEWPGNIRELQNFIQRLFISVDQDYITTEETNKIVQIPKTTSTNLVIAEEKNSKEEAELVKMLGKSEFEILKAYKEKYKTTRKIAQALGWSQTSVVRKLRKYNL